MFSDGLWQGRTEDDLGRGVQDIDETWTLEIRSGKRGKDDGMDRPAGVKANASSG